MTGKSPPAFAVAVPGFSLAASSRWKKAEVAARLISSLRPPTLRFRDCANASPPATSR